jgi:transglutaminase-like putative cysteine protease
MILRIGKWFLNLLGVKALVGFSLLLVALISAAYSWADVIRELQPWLLVRLAFLALLFSWLIAGRKIRAWIASVLLIVVGVGVTLISVGQLFSPLLALAQTALNTTWEILMLSPGDSIDLSNLSFAYTEVYYGFSTIFTALFEWIQSILDGLPLINETAISLLWGFVMWIASSWAGWMLRKNHRPLLSILPVGILTISIMAYTWAETAILAPLLFATLMLFAFVNFDRSEEYWKSANMDYPEDLPKEFSLTTVVMVAGIVMVALLIPSIPIRGIVDYVSEFTKPQIEEAEPVIKSFGLEQSSIPQGDVGSALRGGLPRLHLIGSGPELSEQIVMTVQVSGDIPQDQAESLSLPLYWRSLIYDEYYGLGWRSSEIIMRTYEAGEEVVSRESPHHQIIQQDFRMAQGKTRFLYAAGHILTADDVFKIAYRPTPRFTEIFDAHGDFFGASIDQSRFKVQSLIPNVSEEELRSTQEEYPNWIKERYLPLPDSIPSRVSNLAAEVTQGEPTPYDKARKLESYLRGFEYTLDVELPPLRSDMVDYFLFDLQKGYCDYYATSMAVMARSLGIPARLAIGYVRGTYDQVNDRYIVTEAEAHSWVEIYFPGVGWVPFEPTAGRSAIERLVSPLEEAETFEESQPLGSLVPRAERLDWYWGTTLVSLAVGVVLLAVSYSIFDNFRLLNWSPSQAVERLYQRLYRFGRHLGIHTEVESTPLEFSSTLVDRLEWLGQDSIFESILGTASVQVQEITKTYILMLYSPMQLTINDRNKVIRLWKRLRRRLVVARLRQLLQKAPLPVRKLRQTAFEPDGEEN